MTAALVATSASAAEPADLITVKVKGTSINVLPAYVDIIVDDPEGQADILARRRSLPMELKRHHGATPAVMLNKVHYFFFKPEDRNSDIQGHQFRDGDVVYGFELSSSDEAAEFVKRHNLKLHARIASQQGSFSLYRASPGYYVICAVPVRRFTCSMHPQIARKAEGRCPICAMNLILVEAYQPVEQLEAEPTTQRRSRRRTGANAAKKQFGKGER
ncbi:MAG: heavy metal-binding domain-containing protein [Planctomycetota bacterium]